MPTRLRIGSEELSHYAARAFAQLGGVRVEAEDYESLAQTEETAGCYYAAAAYYVLAEVASVGDRERASWYADLVARAIEQVGKPDAPTLW